MIDILLLLALPASGKSEVRRYLEHLDAATLRRDMHLGPTIQLDDYPYVHLMRRISQELRVRDLDPVFFESDESAWSEPLDWLTLTRLLDEDVAAALSGGAPAPDAATLLDRLEAARTSVGASGFNWSASTRTEIEEAITPDLDTLQPVPAASDDTTLIVEFARGGPTGASLPLPHPLGYRASLAQLDDAVLARSSILYVWVEPDESRRRNRERAHPDGDASILHHGVPELVMQQEYGVDDMTWLEEASRGPGTIPIGDHDIPTARFDNRDDRTSFLRGDPTAWPSDAVASLHEELSAALRSLSTS